MSDARPRGHGWVGLALLAVAILGLSSVGNGLFVENGGAGGGGMATAPTAAPHASAHGPPGAGDGLSFARGWDAALASYAPTVKDPSAGSVANLTDAQIAHAFRGTPYANLSLKTIRAALGNFQTFTSAGQYFQDFAAGCAVGAAIGFIGAGPIGAGVGCVAAGAITDLVIYFTSTAANSAAAAVELQFQLGLVADFYNSILYSNGLVTLTQSVANSTGNAWDTMADNAALAQLPNASFDPLQAMNLSSVSFQMATLAQDYANAATGAINAVGSAEYAGYAPGGSYASSCFYNLAFAGQQAFGFGCLASGTQFYAHVEGALEGSATNGTGLQVNQNGWAWISCSGGSSPAYFDGAGAGAGSYKVSVPMNGSSVLFKAPYTGVWVARLAGGGTCDLVGQAFIMVPLNSGSPSTQVVVVGCGYQHTASFVCDPTDQAVASFKTRLNGTMEVEQTRSGSGAQSQVYTVHGTTGSWFKQVDTLVVNAETNARTYWLFLHILGYTNANQIPSNCVIPMPGQELPPQYNWGLGAISLNQSLSLYAAWMNGLATFFNTQPSSSNFCSGHQRFNVGQTTWNVNVVVTGFIYTLPVAHQNFGTTSTWTVTNASVNGTRVGNTSALGLRTQPTPLVLWPAVKTLYAKIGVVQEVPVDAPLDAFVPANGTFYQLFGNGTNAGSTGFSNGTATSSAGAALFISTCRVLTGNLTYTNAPGGYCPLVLSSIVNVTFNTSTTTVVSPSFGGSACGESIPIFDTLVTFFTTVFGASTLGCFAAEFSAAVVLIVAVVVVAWVLVAIFRRG